MKILMKIRSYTNQKFHSQHFFLSYLPFCFDFLFASSNLKVFFFVGDGADLFFYTSFLIKYPNASSTPSPVFALTTKNSH